MPFSLILDVTVAILLVITIGYAIVLNGKLSRLRNDRAELENLGETFSASVLRTEQGLRRLKKTAEDLQDNIAKAESLREDLAYLIDRGSTTADILVERVRQSRDGAPLDGAAPRRGAQGASQEERGVRKTADSRDKGDGKGDGSETQAGDTPRAGASEAERELLEALRSVR